MSIIVDGMDQKTTMVSKMKQKLKYIEWWFFKTHLCAVLVHGIGLYPNVWLVANHKHDSNEVVTSLIHVITDVKRRRWMLSPTLRSQAGNTTREYIEHIDIDIDQHFSTISNTSKMSDIDLMKDLLSLAEKWTSYTEAFVSARNLDNVRDWKSFITYLLKGSDTLTGITFPYHMQFYMLGWMPRVQSKTFGKDAWAPTDGHPYLRLMLTRDKKPMLAEVFRADARELWALQVFVVYKERCLERFWNIEKNLEAIDQTKWLEDYLEECPEQDRSTPSNAPF